MIISDLSGLKTPRNYAGIIPIPILIFLSIIPRASADVWHETLVFALIFLLCGINVWSNKLEIEAQRLLVPLFILAAYSFLQGFASLLSQTEVFVFPANLIKSLEPTASIWSAFKILGFALFLSLLFKCFRHHAKILALSLIVTGNFFALFGIARFLLQADYPSVFNPILAPQLTTGIGFGTFYNQNHFAYLMLMVFGLNLGLFWFGKQSKGIRIFLLLAGLTTWTALVLTGSRGGIIGSFAEIVVLIVLPFIFLIASKNNKHKTFQAKVLLAVRQFLILLAVFALLIIGIALIGQERVVERFEHIPQQIEGVTDAATYRRIDVWRATIEIIKENPFFGIGFGGFRVGVSQYINISGQLVPEQSHNDYLELAASGGIIAIILGVWFLYNFSLLLKKRLTEPSDSFSIALRAGAICGISGVGLHSLFDFGLQITSNLLFFGALLYLALHKPEYRNDPDDFRPPHKNLFFINLFFSILCAMLVFSASFFGYGRYRLEQARNTLNIEFLENNLFQIPFDAAYYETRAAIYENLKKPEAADELKKAIRYRPKDYRLWVKLGNAEQSQGNLQEAENAFRRAAELAPFYGEPHFYYGKILLKINRTDEGFAELRIAIRRDPQYFGKVIGLVWLEKAGKTEEVIKVLSPIDPTEKEQLISFLFDKKEFPAIVQLACREEDFPPQHREELIRKLFEERQYYFAYKIYKRDCDVSNAITGEIEDGGFDDENLKDRVGFGWRIQSLSRNTTVGLNQENGIHGRSLKFDFNGQEDSPALLSQVIIVEKNRKYRLLFSYKASKIVTGGVPILRVILKQPDLENIAKEANLSLEESGWVQSSIEFESGDRTEAVEIRLTRRVCPQTLCPIFGQLWLDDFSLQKKN
jgi:O-antigen ligase